MSKQFWGILIAIALIFVGVLAFGGDKKSGNDFGKPTSHIEGKSPKGVTLVEYGDFQCPVCGAYYLPVKNVVEKYKDKVQFQFRNFPIQSAHPNAFAASRAAEAAALQDKYWEMHDKLYETQDQNGQAGWVGSQNPLDEYFTGFAKELGLNVTKFKKDYASTKVNNLINADMAKAKALDVTGTPTFFLNGKDLIKNSDLTDANGAPSEEKFAEVLDAALKAAK